MLRMVLVSLRHGLVVLRAVDCAARCFCCVANCVDCEAKKLYPPMNESGRIQLLFITYQLHETQASAHRML